MHINATMSNILPLEAGLQTSRICCEDAHAVILMTEWSIYKTLDWEKILPIVKKPFWVFDTRLILNPNEIKNLGRIAILLNPIKAEVSTEVEKYAIDCR